MRRAAFTVIGLGLVVVVAIGLLTSRQAAPSAAGPVPAAAQAQRELAGSPPALAALHAQAGQLLAGGPAAFHERLGALRGHPVVVNLWASWCPPCRSEFPVFQRASAQLGRRVAFLGLDVEDNGAAAHRFLAGHPVSYPSYAVDAPTVARDVHAQGLPTTLFYDRRGRLASVHQGEYRSEADLRADVRRYALGAA